MTAIGAQSMEPEFGARALRTPRSAAYAGIAFRWFVGVVRDRIGEAEDRFFATEATAAGLVSSLGSDSRSCPPRTIGRHVSRGLLEGGLQMLGVIATSTLMRRAAVGPRWPAVVGYGIAALLLVAASRRDRAAREASAR